LGASLDASEARRKAERTLEKLKFLKYSVAGLMDSTLYKEVPRRAFVSTTLKMTNILANDVHYRRVSELWLAWARLGLEQTPRPEGSRPCRTFAGGSTRSHCCWSSVPSNSSNSNQRNLEDRSNPAR
jgi:hypothetical protein